MDFFFTGTTNQVVTQTFTNDIGFIKSLYYNRDQASAFMGRATSESITIASSTPTDVGAGSALNAQFNFSDETMPVGAGDILHAFYLFK